MRGKERCGGKVDHAINTRESNKEISKVLYVMIALMAIFLNQSQIIFNVNISFADFFCIMVLMILIFKRNLILPLVPMIFFLLLSAFVLCSATFFVPTKFLYNPQPYRIISDYIKLLVVFIYFIIGYNISRLQLIKRSIKCYCVFGLFIGIVSVVFTIFKVRIFSDTLFYGGLRLRGLMSDPNYFSILQISTLAFFTREKNLKTTYKMQALMVIVLSILMTGSKTGFITLVCYLSLRTAENLFKSNQKLSTLIKKISVVVIVSLAAPIVLKMFQNITYKISYFIPAFTRIQYLFTNFDAAISEGGSGRDATWHTALEIIKDSPIFGVGVGTYSGIAKQVFGSGELAHNTYLQLFSEWGIFLSVIFLFYVFLTIIRVTYSRKVNAEISLILRDIIIVFLIGSMSISLNNARMFWLFLGALIFNIQLCKRTSICTKAG